ncbi:hypothetical protein GCM10027452_45200 [Micromonospora halotolerans]
MCGRCFPRNDLTALRNASALHGCATFRRHAGPAAARGRRGGTWLDFSDARVTLDPEAGAFTARIAPARLAATPLADSPSSIAGRFAVDAELMRTAAVPVPG